MCCVAKTASVSPNAASFAVDAIAFYLLSLCLSAVGAQADDLLPLPTSIIKTFFIISDHAWTTDILLLVSPAVTIVPFARKPSV